MIVEHVVRNHLKVVYVCSDDGLCDVFGDVTPVRSCVQVEQCLSIDNVDSCITRWFEIEGLSIRLTVAKVAGEYHVISFQASRVSQGFDAERLVSIVEEFARRACSSA